MKHLLVATAGLGLTFGVATTSLLAQSDSDASEAIETVEKKVEKTYQDAKASLFDLLDKNSVDVKFDEGSALLTDSAKSDIKGLVDSVKKDSKIESISIAVWADAEAPLADGETLPEEQTELAQKRIDALDDYVNTLGKADVDTYNMSKRVGWFADLFNTDEAVAKKTMADPNERVESYEDRLTAAKARAFKEKGGASEAVIVVIRDKAELSH